MDKRRSLTVAPLAVTCISFHPCYLLQWNYTSNRPVGLTFPALSTKDVGRFDTRTRSTFLHRQLVFGRYLLILRWQASHFTQSHFAFITFFIFLAVKS